MQIGVTEEQLEAQLAEQRKVLHAVRSARTRPILDDKVRLSCNHSDWVLGYEGIVLTGHCRYFTGHKPYTPSPDPPPTQVVTAWNGMAISALALASRALSSEDPPCGALFPVDGCSPKVYLEAALRAARFVREHLYNETEGTLTRSFRNGPSSVPGELI